MREEPYGPVLNFAHWLDAMLPNLRIKAENHAVGCWKRQALLTPVECIHGYGICPECDPCNCGGMEDGRHG